MKGLDPQTELQVGALDRSRQAASRGVAAWTALLLLAAPLRVTAAQAGAPGDDARAAPPAAADSAAANAEPSRDLPFDDGLPSSQQLSELVSYAEPVAASPHSVRLESFHGDTINGVFLVDSDDPTARHVAFGKDPGGGRYVWFSRRNPLRASLVAIYEVDGRGLPDVMYWRQIDFEARAARTREFRSPAAGNRRFDYSAGPPCGRGPCEGWIDLPLERLQVAKTFFEPLGALFRSAAEHGEPWLGRRVDEIPQPGLSENSRPQLQAVASRT